MDTVSNASKPGRAKQSGSAKRLQVKYPSLPNRENGPVYYLAGRMTGLPEYNYPTFRKAAFLLRARGLTVVSPHELELVGIPNEDHHLLDPETLWKTMMSAAMVCLIRCNNIILMVGWSESKGARRELDSAMACGHRLWYYDPDTDNLIEVK